MLSCGNVDLWRCGNMENVENIENMEIVETIEISSRDTLQMQ